MFSCNPGFVLEGGRKRICGEDGRWTGNVPFCSEIPVLGVWVILSDFSGENIAFGGIASQSHVLWSYGPQLATDGNKQTCSFTTRKGGQRWWQVRPYCLISLCNDISLTPCPITGLPAPPAKGRFSAAQPCSGTAAELCCLPCQPEGGKHSRVQTL